MKSLLFSTLLALALPAAGAGEAPLPPDSVYQLQAQLVDQGGQRGAWSAQRGKPRLVAMFYTSCKYICPLGASLAIEQALRGADR